MVIPKHAQVVRIGRYRGFIPASWNDLPRPTLLRVFAFLLAAGYETGLEAEEVLTYHRIGVLAALLGTDIPPLLAELGVAEGELLEDDQLSAVVTVLDMITFCFERVDVDDDTLYRFRLRLDLTRCPYESIRLPSGKNLYPPSTGCENISLFELSHLWSAMDAYAQDHQAEDLHRALTIVFRPAKRPTPENMEADFHGDRRLPLYGHDHQIEQRARYWKRAPQLTKQLLWFWLSSCRAQLVNHPALAILFERSGNSSPDPFGWSGTMLHLADDSLVNLPGVATQNHRTALMQLARERVMAEEERRRTTPYT